MSIRSESRRVAKASNGLVHYYNLASELTCGMPGVPYPVDPRTAVTCMRCVTYHARWLAQCGRGRGR